MLADKKKITIAIVDDHPIVLEGLQKVLMQAYDYVSTICFSTGGEFLKFIKKAGTGTDIVLMDITLPDINGIDLSREVKMLSADTACWPSVITMNVAPLCACCRTGPAGTC